MNRRPSAQREREVTPTEHATGGWHPFPPPPVPWRRRRTSKTLAEIPTDEIDTVITPCGDAAERCPVFPGVATREHRALPDRPAAEGSEEAILGVFRPVRNEPEKRVREELAAVG